MTTDGDLFLLTNLDRFFGEAKKQLIVLGTNPLSPYLEQSAEWLSNLLVTNAELQLTVLYESDTENFNQAVCADGARTGDSASYASLTVHRDRIAGTPSNAGLLREICDHIEDPGNRRAAEQRIFVRQMNLRNPISAILADERLWVSVTMRSMPDLESYIEVKHDDPLYRQVREWIDYLLDSDGGRIYLSSPDEELIWVFDKDGIARGIFPRAAFYTTEFRRYSVWGLVFNRRGELLLQRRSEQTKDNRGLWDKSIGGHVDLEDASTSITAKRELVEEMFLPEAEFTKYLRADLGDIIDFGDWNPRKRPERYFREAFGVLGPSDWVLFRATDTQGLPLTITRVSNRRLHLVEGEEPALRRTVFMSDVYVFIAPDGYLDSESQMKELVAVAEEKGAASAHQLVTIAGLHEWIAKCEREGTHADTFTDDLLSLDLEHRPLLEQFAEFIRFIFRSG